MAHNAQPYWALTSDEALRALETSPGGLTEEEAAARLAAYGKNTIAENSRATGLSLFLNQFKSPLILMLVAAGGVMLFLKDFVDAGFIAAAVLVNTLLGYYQEHKAETALQSLKTYLKERVRVRRGRDREVDAETLVPGDIVMLAPGSRVPADIRLIRAVGLHIDESILTGESLAVKKDAGSCPPHATIGERVCIAWSGTLVESGIGEGVAFATGGVSELGRIASLVKTHEEATPLQRAVGRFAANAALIILVLTGALFLVGLARGVDLFTMFITSVAIAVSAVPEGLPVALTVILAVGVERLAHRRAVVRRLLAAETLGRTTIILTDKTGTLTEGKLELTDIISTHRKEELLELALLLTDVLIENPEEPWHAWRLVGRPLESAIVRAAGAHAILLESVKPRVAVHDFHPFNSTLKKSSVHITRRGVTHWLHLGAPELLAESLPIARTEKERIAHEVETLADQGARVLGLATEKEFLGLLTFRDPVRENVKDVVAKVHRAGIRVVIATGDHQGTARAVAREIGIEAGEGAVMSGAALAEMDDATLASRLPSVAIFARITPEDKLRIVNLYKQKGEVVAMTGDGVNDAPAIKAADIGVAVGSGTDVAKGAADLVLVDDNLETLVHAVEEGRRILGNVRKTIIYLLSGCLDEVTLIGGSILMGLVPPINALQVLWVNFFSDSFPAVAFAFERGGDHLERHGKASASLFDRDMRFFILFLGATTSIMLFVLYLGMLGAGHDPALTRSFIFTAFSVYSLFITLSLRNLDRPLFRYNVLENKPLVGGIAIGLMMTALALYLPPLSALLGTVPLPPLWLLGVGLVCAANIIAFELGKFLLRGLPKT